MRIFLLLSFFVVSLFAYGTGDKVDAAVRSKMGLDRGKISVVSFFASWCDSCKKELPQLCTLDLKGAGAELIGVDVDTDLDNAKTFQAQFPIGFRVINDTDQQIVEAFSPLGMPALYYVKEGVVVKKRYGALPHITDVIKKDLEGLR